MASGYVPIDTPPGAAPLPLGAPAPGLKGTAPTKAPTPPAPKKPGKPGGKSFGKRKLTARRRSS